MVAMTLREVRRRCRLMFLFVLRGTFFKGDAAAVIQAYALRITAVPVMHRGVTETGLTIHPVQFWSMGIKIC